jgi:hypothetical protein
MKITTKVTQTNKQTVIDAKQNKCIAYAHTQTMLEHSVATLCKSRCTIQNVAFIFNTCELNNF